MKKRTKALSLLFGGVVMVIVLIWFWVRFTSVYWFSQRERGSLLIERGGEVSVISLDLKNHLGYLTKINNDLVVRAPGGFGDYPFQGVVKLSRVEDDPTLILRSASWLIGAPIDDFVISDRANENSSESDFSFIWDRGKTKSNLRILDRWWWWWQLKKNKQENFLTLQTYFPKDREDLASRKIFSPDKFSQSYEGYFFDSRIRNEDIKVKIIYKSHYSAAENLARVWRGVGVRVVGLDRDATASKVCVLTIDPLVKANSFTTRFLSDFGDCDVQTGRSEGVDIRLNLGEKLENKWY